MWLALTVAPTTLQGVRTLLWCGRLKLHKTGNEVRHVGNCRSCQKQIFAPFSEERRFRILNVLFAKRNFPGNATWLIRKRWQFSKLRFLSNGTPISTVAHRQQWDFQQRKRAKGEATARSVKEATKD